MQLYCMQLARLEETGRLTDTIAGLAKLNNTRKARQVIAEARDLLGGNGILLENHVIRHMGDIEVDPHLRGHRDDADADRRPRHHRGRRLPVRELTPVPGGVARPAARRDALDARGHAPARGPGRLRARRAARRRAAGDRGARASWPPTTACCCCAAGCGSSGYRPHTAGFLFNVDCADRAVERVERLAEALNATTGPPRRDRRPQPRRAPRARDRARAGPSSSRTRSRWAPTCRGCSGSARRRARRSGSCDAACTSRAAAATPTASARAAAAASSATTPREFPVDRVRLTSIYTKGDGVVRWERAIVEEADCVEVTGSHIGLMANRKAYRAIAAALARPELTVRTRSRPRLFVTDRGAGEPVLLITGWTISSAVFDPVAELYLPHVRIIAYDHRGTGRSAPWPAPVSMAMLAADAARVLDDRGDRRRARRRAVDGRGGRAGARRSGCRSASRASSSSAAAPAGRRRRAGRARGRRHASATVLADSVRHRRLWPAAALFSRALPATSIRTKVAAYMPVLRARTAPRRG